ncbi:MAG: DUF4129 domain-containing protein [Caldilineaceae bacterium]|nr:DUF4129 domain-containing protein [Caldilineaceae bacterium]
MNLNQRTTTLLQLTIALAALLLLAAGMGGLRFEPGQDLNLLALLLGNGQMPTAQPSPAIAGTANFQPWMRIALWLLLIFTGAYAIVSPEARRRLFMTLIFVLLILFIAEKYRDRLQQQPRETPTVQGVEALPEVAVPAIPEPPPFITDPPVWLSWAVNTLVAIAFFLLLWYLWLRLRPKPTPQSLLVDEAASALAELEAGGDLRDVVLRCYVQMSAVLKENHRVERRQAMTPREFEDQLAAVGLGNEHIHRLTLLFEGVRYGTQASTDKTAQEASDCLQAIVQTYGART